jgi:hypothetical protein
MSAGLADLPAGAKPTTPGPADGGPTAPAPPRGFAVTSVAVVSVLLVGLAYRLPLVHYGTTTATVPAVLILPVCLSAVSHFRYARTLLVLAFVAVAGGTGMALLALGRYQIDRPLAISQAVLILTSFLSVGVLLWAARVLTIGPTALLYGLATLVGNAVTPGSWGMNPWKYAFALPTAIILLSLVGRRNLVGQLIALGLLGVVSAAFDYRSFFGFCMLCGVLLAWQRIGGWKPPRPKAAPIIAVGALGIAMYYLGTSLLVDGVLGQKLQERSEAQIQASGSLLLGGRPEWSGTARLMALRPEGYGLGVVPGHAEVAAVKAGFASINVDYNTGYVERFMVGPTFRLHSIVADLWADSGFFGLLLCAMVVFILVSAFTVRLAMRTATPLFIFMVLLALWDLAFGTSYTNLPDVTLALALALFPAAAAVRRTRAERIAERRAARVLARRPTVLGVPPTRGTRPRVPSQDAARGPADKTGASGALAGAGRQALDGLRDGARNDADAADPDETHQYLHVPNSHRYGAQT